MNIYAGNLSRQTTEEDLKKEFEAFGQVESVNIIKDKFTGESSGFGFVSMPSQQEAQKAIDELNGKELMDRVIKVAQAKPRTDRPRRGGGGGRFSGGGRGGSRGSWRGERRGGGERPGGERRGGREGRDPEEMRRRMEEFRKRADERLREQLKASEKEWKIIQPRLEAVRTAQSNTRGGRGRFGRTI